MISSFSQQSRRLFSLFLLTFVDALILFLLVPSHHGISQVHSFRFSSLSSSSSSLVSLKKKGYMSQSQKLAMSPTIIRQASQQQRRRHHHQYQYQCHHHHLHCLFNSKSSSSASSSSDSSSSIIIRDWEDGEGNEIYTLLHNSSKMAATTADATANYDPEGQLENDCGTEIQLKDSYTNDDGGCFIVAAKATAATAKTGNGVDDDISDNDDEQPGDTGSGTNAIIIGTAGLITGTSISYLKSGASISSPEIITGAIRRVVVSAEASSTNANAKEEEVEDEEESKISQVKLLLKELLIEIEDRAKAEGVQELILLAYPRQQNQKQQQYLRPYPSLLESMGYKELPTMKALADVGVLQYCKNLNG